MPDAWPNAAADDEQPFLASRAGGGHVNSRRTKPSRRKSTSAISVLVILLLPIVFLLWMTSWTAPLHILSNPISSAAPDALVLDPGFNTSAAQTTRIYHWIVSAVAVPGANRTRTVVNGCSLGPIIEANAHDRILVYVTNGLKEEGTSIHWYLQFNIPPRLAR
ncbi:hypothetical protein DFH08DRAFT_276953 [Mycena albidolilacea]|uniref:Plastocyanin-like domain-containing protein n=1 Tax=Mycena albidolilacea TaxID=1033008 RepID=A0AAD7APT2_9AGAR|nr:hypothetical protein DFH08DRAFT_276953 [Mycena albidolilacea]